MNHNTIQTYSRLGFGLSSIAGSGNFAHQERLIRTAIDCGITHFDVAPYYGSGDAEKILGDILSNVKEEVTVTTKFGLIPVGGGVSGSMLRAALRPIFRRMKSLKQIASKVVRKTHQSKPLTFNPGDLKESLDASLKKLQRPVDIFLLHDADYAFATNPALIEELEQAKTQGSAILTGVSGNSDTVTRLVNEYSQQYPVAQLENSLKNPAPIAELEKSASYIITHRAIQGGINELFFLLEMRPKFAQVWAREIGVDITNKEELANILIELALFENKRGTILFSTTHPDRIKRVAQAYSSPVLSESEYAKIRTLFEDVYIERETVN